MIPSPSPSVKIQILGRKVCLRCKGKTLLWMLSTNFWIQKVCWQYTAMFCLYVSSKLSCLKFEFSLKVKVMRSNPGYLLKSSLLNVWSIFQYAIKITFFLLENLEMKNTGIWNVLNVWIRFLSIKMKRMPNILWTKFGNSGHCDCLGLLLCYA